jgi:hypothetical protein
VSDPSPTPLPGSPAGKTALGPFALRVPQAGPIGSLTDPFEVYATDTLAALRQFLRRLHSQYLLQGADAIDPEPGWARADEVSPSKVRAIGEVWAYGQFTLRRTGDDITVPSNGDITPLKVGAIASEAMWPISLARLVSSNAGVMAVGHTNSTGDVWLDALATGSKIETNDIITLGGMWPLATLHDSEED